MDNCTLPDFLPGSTNGVGRRRYALQEMMCMRATCLGKPSGMQDYAKDGSLLQCSLLADRSNPFSWEQLAGSLQDAMSSSDPYTDGPTSPPRGRPIGISSSPSWRSPDKRSPDKRSRLQHSSSAHDGFYDDAASPAGPSSPSCRANSRKKLVMRAFPTSTTSASSPGNNRISDGASDSRTSADNDPVPQQPLRDMLAATLAASKQQKQQCPKPVCTTLPSSPRASPSPSSHMRGTFAPSPTTSPARVAAPAASAGFIPASPARAEPLPLDVQDNILELVSLLGCADPSTTAQAAEQLAALAFTSAAHPGFIVAAGAVEPLAKMLRGAASDEQQQGAAAALWGLARGSSAHQAIIIDSNAVPRMTRMLGSSSSTLVYTALSALNELAGPPGANQQRQQVFADAGAVQMLCTCLKAQAAQGSIMTQQVAAEVLLALAVGNYENQAIIVKQRAVEALVDMLDLQDYPAAAPQAVAVHLLLELVVGHHAGNTAAVFAAGALPRLEALLHPSAGFHRHSEEGIAVSKVIGKLYAWQRRQKQAAMSAIMAKEAALLQQLQQSQAGQVGQQLGRGGSLPLPVARPSSSGSLGTNGW
uniref:Armadillo repeat-containing domain-containing protein n=2 Tax=Tetradesmus obliquus TaxID=3088 RepID=A0A383V5X6_TETOB|eukprot:jgi/Sobl393_1/453/SZX59766.1